MAEEKKKAVIELKDQRARWGKKFHERLKSEVKQGAKLESRNRRSNTRSKKPNCELPSTYWNCLPVFRTSTDDS
jgi:hypothetical protein